MNYKMRHSVLPHFPPLGVPLGIGRIEWGTITNLAYSVKSASSVYLSWVLPSGTYDGVRVYSSTNGVDYSQVGSDLPAGTTSYTHSSIDAGSDRWWYVTLVKGAEEVGASSVVRLDWFTMQCTTTGAATLTLTRVDCVAGDGITIFWGDSTANSYTSANNGSAKTRAYAGAGTYTVKIANPWNISVIDFKDTKLTNFNTNQFLKCGDNLETLLLDTLGAGRVINSDNLKHLKLKTTLFLYFPQAGTYTINSDHFKNYTLNSTLYLYFVLAGTYIINSEHFKDYRLTYWMYINFYTAGTYIINSDHFKNYTLGGRFYLVLQAEGTYIINSDHFKNYTLNDRFYLTFTYPGIYTINTAHFKNYTVTQYSIIFNTTGTFSKTVSRSDFTLYRLTSFTITMGLTQQEVDNILLGFYDTFPSKTSTGGTINLNGTGNAAPSGVYGPSANCSLDPDGGKGAAYELINDSCDRANNHWTTINVVGGLP